MASCDENWELDEKLNLYAFKKFITSRVAEWIILFPEVNIFTQEASDLHMEMSEKYYLPKFHHILYPRFSGFYNTVQLLNDSAFSRMYDITVVYYKNQEDDQMMETSNETIKQKKMNRKERKEMERLGKLKEEAEIPLLSESSSLITGGHQTSVLRPGGVFKSPTLLEILSVSPSNYVVRVHVRSKLLSSVPTRRRKLEKWLENLWYDKDKLIELMQREMLHEISES